MLNREILRALKNIGLTEKEARVYLSALELGSIGAAKIGKRAGLNRVTTYDILEKLVQKGFANFFHKNGIRYFNATDPELILGETARHMNEFKHFIPDLKRMRGESIHPKIQYFEGVEGIKAIYADTLTSKTEILNFANSQEIRKFWPEYDQDYVEKRAKKKIRLRGIAPMDPWGEQVHSEDKKYLREIRLVPKEKFNFTNEINIYDNKVAIASFKEELIGMIIESNEIANTHRAIFEMTWEYAGNIRKNFSI